MAVYLQDHVVPVTLGAAESPYTNPQTFVTLGNFAPGSFRLTDVSFEPTGTAVQFRLPDLEVQNPIAYGGETTETLHGVSANAASHPKLPIGLNIDCETVPLTPDASGSELWAAAQCERLRGTSVDRILKALAQRCETLARTSIEARDAYFSADEATYTDDPNARRNVRRLAAR